MSEEARARVFISHSTKDKPFVRRLVADLTAEQLNVWVDEKELRVGDSIVEAVFSGLDESDYVLVVLSESSVASMWVRAELNAALASQLAGRGIVVLPLRIDDSEPPMSLSDRLYADFRKDYGVGLASVLDVLKQEHPSHVVRARGFFPHRSPEDECCTKLAERSDAEVRRLIHRLLDRSEIRALWHALLGSDMNDDMEGRDKLSCAVTLIIRAGRRGLAEKLRDELCSDHPDLWKRA